MPFAALTFHLQNTSLHGVNAFYSTPTEYARAKLSYPVTWPSVNGSDGFPYADGPHSYWAGFFTSRPALKGYVRACSAQFQALKQLQVWSGGAEDMSASNPLYLLERALGVAQHHDAVAGTEQQHVAFNYALRLAQGRAAADALVASSFANRALLMLRFSRATLLMRQFARPWNLVLGRLRLDCTTPRRSVRALCRFASPLDCHPVWRATP